MKIMILAGEVSGDIHAAHLVHELKKKNQEYTFFGMGGPRLKQEGVELLYELKDLAVLGLSEVLRKYFHFRRIFYHLKERACQEKPSVLILVDYPGFNVRFAKVAKKLGIPIVYYISPQIWAWAKWRRYVIANRVDKMLVVFPFEKEVYRGTGLDVEFVGHPLVDRDSPYAVEFPSSKRKNETTTLGLFPGSRQHEIETLFPLMLKAAAHILEKKEKVRFIASAANESTAVWMKKQITSLPVEIKKEKLSALTQKVDLAVVASGTATLECALALLPIVIVYKVAFLTWLIGKMVVRLPYIGLVNVVLGKQVVPELIQFDAQPDKIAKEVLSLLDSPDRIQRMRQSLSEVRSRLGTSGASARAAQSIMEFLKSA